MLEKSLSSTIKFNLSDGRDVYNISAPIDYFGRSVIAGRVERRDSEDAEIQLFQRNGLGWESYLSAPEFVGLQDPCVTMIRGKWVLGGVRFPCVFDDGSTGWQMDFYQCHEEGRFELLFSGPKKMKDIRLLELSDGRILVMTRPQGEKGGAGRVGFTIVKHLSDITVGVIEEAPLLQGLCKDDEWVGANELHLLSNGKVGVLGHVAFFGDDKQRHYHAMAFVLDLKTGTTSPVEVIAKRCDFPEGPAKRPDLSDVLFPGGMLRLPDGRARIYAGLSDVEAGFLEIVDPFLAHE